jgi:broad specificity phosphatase PhoE
MGAEDGAAGGKQTGTAFFVRHGESTSNDRNVFAGAAQRGAQGAAATHGLARHPGGRAVAVRRCIAASLLTCGGPASRPGIHDVYLTAYGKLQARRAGQARARAAVPSTPDARPHCSSRCALPGADSRPLRRTLQDIKRRDIKFDAVFVSHMRRARQTCNLVLEEAEPDCTLTHTIDHRLAEKSFGIFAGRNINVLRMVRVGPRWARRRSRDRRRSKRCHARADASPRLLRARCTAARRSTA